MNSASTTTSLLPQLPAPDELDEHGQGLYSAHRVLDLMLQAYAKGAQSVDVSVALERLEPAPKTIHKPIQSTAHADWDDAMRRAIRSQR